MFKGATPICEDIPCSSDSQKKGKRKAGAVAGFHLPALPPGTRIGTTRCPAKHDPLPHQARYAASPGTRIGTVRCPTETPGNRPAEAKAASDAVAQDTPWGSPTKSTARKIGGRRGEGHGPSRQATPHPLRTTGARSTPRRRKAATDAGSLGARRPASAACQGFDVNALSLVKPLTLRQWGRGQEGRTATSRGQGRSWHRGGFPGSATHKNALVPGTSATATTKGHAVTRPAPPKGTTAPGGRRSPRKPVCCRGQGSLG